MCGITGIYSFSEKNQQLLSKISAATETLKKRGPDGSGIFSENKVALGHCRLSIIDTSAIANQPMYDDEERHVIIYNGEIFNFRELKTTYLSNENFRTHSDTEVFLKLYKKFKEETFSLLRGFFAAAIYDRATERLTLVRDRFGKKPLLYYKAED
ncbi:MAG: asparagine synthetase B, partial [Chitinophagaceae bacterium]|nr:asparagine synthetase B [Chitinophagaceae bacterium]